MTPLPGTTLPAPRRGGKAVAWRLGAIALFLGLPLGVATSAAFGLVAYLEATDRAAQEEDTARAIVHQLDRRSDSITKALDTAPLYLSSLGTSLAEAELQALVAGRVEAVGGRLEQSQPLDGSEQDPPGSVVAEITFNAGNAGLLDVLHAIEAGLPILDVKRLDVHAENAAEGSDSTGDVLRVAMTVRGSWKAPLP